MHNGSICKEKKLNDLESQKGNGEGAVQGGVRRRGLPLGCKVNKQINEKISHQFSMSLNLDGEEPEVNIPCQSTITRQ